MQSSQHSTEQDAISSVTPSLLPDTTDADAPLPSDYLHQKHAEQNAAQL